MARRLIFVVWMLGLFLLSAVFAALEEKPLIGSEMYAKIDQVPPSLWERLSAKRIFFGHQSVGSNIIEGVEELARENNKFKIRIIEGSDPNLMAKPAFLHSLIGANGDPRSKLSAFRDIIEKEGGDHLDIAFFKFCPWDFDQGTDIEKVFMEYRETLSQLETKYPKIKFVHLTVPLKIYPVTVKARIKRIFNIPIESDIDNVKINEFNEKLLKEYIDKEPVIDIASMESSKENGQRTVFPFQGKLYPYLNAEYTFDGTHLNEMARKRLAGQFLVALANIAY